MTTGSAFPTDEPHRLLASTHELTQRVRKAQRATWFPLLIFAVVTFAAIPVDRYSPVTRGACGAVSAAAGPAGRVCTVFPTAGLVYWPLALTLAYAAIAAWYLHTSRVRWVGTRVWPYVTAGIIIAALLTGASLWAEHHVLTGRYDILGLHLGPFQAQNGLFQVASPGAAIGLALLVLAWAERNPALLVPTAGYLAVVLIPLSFGWATTRPWGALPHLVIQGGLLLLAGIGFALVQCRAHPRTA